MIIDFKVTNFRSIRDTMTLSFVAQKGRTGQTNGKSSVNSDDAICAGYPVKGRDFKLLPVAAIYGANASGKSNVLRALDELLSLLAFGAPDERSLRRDFAPFRLDPLTTQAPTEFELRMVLANNIYTIEISIRDGVILREHLEYSPAPGRRQSVRLLYSREWDEKQSAYQTKQGEHFAGPHLQLLNKLQKHGLYLSLLNDLQVELTKPLTDWLSLRGPSIYTHTDEVDRNSAAGWNYDFPEDHEATKEIIRLFDTGLSDILIEEVPISSETESTYRIHALHETPSGQVQWDFKEESLGTQRLFSVCSNLFLVLEFGTPMTVDEFGSNFHPKISRQLIRIFQNPKTNPNGAQLIFTSHDNTLWRGNLLRRDQIWLTEKQRNGSTLLFPLSDYKVRNDMAIDKAYLDGRFGAVPVLPDAEELIASATGKNGANGVADNGE